MRPTLARHNVTLKQLRCFLAVAETGSFTTAANRLCMTQSALTATIQQMEESVGLRMFDRTTRRVMLTDHAARFMAEAERVINGFDSAVSDLVALAQGERGHIRIGAASSVISQFLVPALPRFREAYPGITLSLRNPAAQETERLVLEGEVDFAIDSRYRGHAALDYTPLVRDCYGVVCHRDSPLAGLKRPITWADLTDAPPGPRGHTGISVSRPTPASAISCVITPRTGRSWAASTTRWKAPRTCLRCWRAATTTRCCRRWPTSATSSPAWYSASCTRRNCRANCA